MKTTVHKSIFNLIEIFSFNKSKTPIKVSSKEHCEQKYHHDFYCDAEKIYVPKF